MNFNVGQLVKVRNDLLPGAYYGKDESVYFNDAMSKYRGKVFKIRKCTRHIDEITYGLNGVDFWVFSGDMLIPVDSIYIKLYERRLL